MALTTEDQFEGPSAWYASSLPVKSPNVVACSAALTCAVGGAGKGGGEVVTASFAGAGS